MLFKEQERPLVRMHEKRLSISLMDIKPDAWWESSLLGPRLSEAQGGVSDKAVFEAEEMVRAREATV